MALAEKLTPEAKADQLAEVSDRLGFDLPAEVSPPRPWQALGTLEDDPAEATASPIDWGTLLAAIDARRPAWQADALCLEYPDVAFFPERGESLEPAKAVCARCLCQEECSSYAVTISASAGVWAGETARKLKRSRAA